MKRWEELLTRRDFLSLSLQGGAALLLPSCSSMSPARKRERSVSSSPAAFLRDFGPIDRTLGDTVPREFYGGDRFDRPHSILWDLPQYFATHRPEGETEEVPLVIVGGGMSGLFSAYSLREHKPIVLEQAARFGGNAKGQSWRGMDYSLGAAYIDEPLPGTPMHSFFHELGLKEILRERKTSDPVEYQGKTYDHFWEGETDSAAADQYKKMNDFFSALCNEKERAFPFIPALTQPQLESVRYYDQHDLHTLLSRIVGGKLPSQLETALEYYCWSTYAGSAKELSSAAALNFLAQESRPIYVGAGGNARIGERLLEKLLETIPSDRLRPKSVVVQVKREGNRVVVLYEDSQKKLRKIRAHAAILCCPKFVAAKILVDPEPKRIEAIQRLRYRSYMVANLLLKKSVQATYYDLFMIGKGKTDVQHVRKAQADTNATDFVLANFAAPNDAISVLTFYRAFPFDGARRELIMPEAYAAYRSAFEQQIARDILPLVGAKSSDIVDLRLTVWGHALPLSATGIYRDDTITTVRKPFRERVFFIEQDNWAYPSTQTGATEIGLMKKDIAKLLG